MPHKKRMKKGEREKWKKLPVYGQYGFFEDSLRFLNWAWLWSWSWPVSEVPEISSVINKNPNKVKKKKEKICKKSEIECSEWKCEKMYNIYIYLQQANLAHENV